MHESDHRAIVARFKLKFCVKAKTNKQEKPDFSQLSSPCVQATFEAQIDADNISSYDEQVGAVHKASSVLPRKVASPSIRCMWASDVVKEMVKFQVECSDVFLQSLDDVRNALVNEQVEKYAQSSQVKSSQ